MVQTDPRMPAATALTRFGLGARPGEIDAVGRDARGWLLDWPRNGTARP